MNWHLLHTALFHGLLQRMTRNLHLHPMRTNGLDVVFVLPDHGREYLEGKETGGAQKRSERDFEFDFIEDFFLFFSFFILFHQPLLILHSLCARDGGLADGLADGLCLKLRTSRLSVAIFVSLSFQPVGFNLHIPLEIREKKGEGGSLVSVFAAPLLSLPHRYFLHNECKETADKNETFECFECVEYPVPRHPDLF